MELGKFMTAKKDEAPGELCVKLQELLEELEALEIVFEYNHTAVVLDIKRAIRMALGKKVYVPQQVAENGTQSNK